MKKSQELKRAKKELATGDILTPVNLSDIGDSAADPCFGKEYDLSTEECRMCGDQELCSIKMAAVLGKTRKQLESENHYKDLESLIDKKAVFKSIRTYKRKNLDRKEIIDRLQAKYQLAYEDARHLYREYRKEHTQTN